MDMIKVIIYLFEKYRNIFLSIIIHKMNEKYHLSLIRKYLRTWLKKLFH